MGLKWWPSHSTNLWPALSYELLPLLSQNYFRNGIFIAVFIAFEAEGSGWRVARLLRHSLFLLHTLACIHAEEVDE